MTRVVAGTYAESSEQLEHVTYLLESMRNFGGGLAAAPFIIVIPTSCEIEAPIGAEFDRLSGLIRRFEPSDEARLYFFADKPLAAAVAEEVALSLEAELLVWLDEDTIILAEPEELLLNAGTEFAYRPVMHNRSGSLIGETPDQFWARIYQLFDLDECELFEMTTPADQKQIRAYFNAGLLVTRPENLIFRSWVIDFRRLAHDPLIKRLCHQNINRNIFLHQAALVGAVLNKLDQDQLLELPPNYNYPLFFNRMYDAEAEFENISDVVTLRYDIYFNDPEPDWSTRLRGPQEKLAWLRQRLGGVSAVRNSH